MVKHAANAESPLLDAESVSTRAFKTSHGQAFASPTEQTKWLERIRDPPPSKTSPSSEEDFETHPDPA